MKMDDHAVICTFTALQMCINIRRSQHHTHLCSSTAPVLHWAVSNTCLDKTAVYEAIEETHSISSTNGPALQIQYLQHSSHSSSQFSSPAIQKITGFPTHPYFTTRAENQEIASDPTHLASEATEPHAQVFPCAINLINQDLWCFGTV